MVVQAELHRINKLKNWARKREESLAELMLEEVEVSLTGLSISTTCEAGPADQFIDAILDGDMRLRLSHPKGVCEALRTALELEAFQLATQQRIKPMQNRNEPSANSP